MAARSIDEVLQQLDEIITDSIQRDQMAGAFAALYRGVTAHVKKGIAAGRFEDGPRMERLDVVFANRYLEAYEQYQAGKMPTQSWQLAFDTAKENDSLIIQHLFLGMNAHINLDLGIAAAQIAPGSEIEALEADFMEINRLLSEMIGDTQNRLGEVSPLFWLMDWLGGSSDEKLADFSMKAARDNAWRIACRLAPLAPEALNAEVALIDEKVLLLGELIRRPPGFFHSRLFRIVRWWEEKSPRRVVEHLSNL